MVLLNNLLTLLWILLCSRFRFFLLDLLYIKLKKDIADFNVSVDNKNNFDTLKIKINDLHYNYKFDEGKINSLNECGENKKETFNYLIEKLTEYNNKQDPKYKLNYLYVYQRSKFMTLCYFFNYRF